MLQYALSNLLQNPFTRWSSANRFRMCSNFPINRLSVLRDLQLDIFRQRLAEHDDKRILHPFMSVKGKRLRKGLTCAYNIFFYFFHASVVMYLSTRCGCLNLKSALIVSNGLCHVVTGDSHSWQGPGKRLRAWRLPTGDSKCKGCVSTPPVFPWQPLLI